MNRLIQSVILLRRKMIVYFRYYHFSFKCFDSMYVYVSDGHLGHSGLFDKLKGIISVYALSKVHGKKYKIYFNSPFPLNKYLHPNNVDWEITDIHYALPNSKLIIANQSQPLNIIKVRNRESHFYLYYDILKNIEESYDVTFDWGDLYNELFKPSFSLKRIIDYYRNEIGGDYIAFHFRMVNLLGDKTEPNPDFITLDNLSSEKIKKECYKILGKYALNKKIVVFTDSNIFIEYIKQQKLNNIYVIPGKIKHVGNNDSLDESDVLKVFLDYYLISGAEYVYSVVGKGLYTSAFPEYAAKIGHKPFKRITIES